MKTDIAGSMDVKKTSHPPTASEAIGAPTPISTESIAVADKNQKDQDLSSSGPIPAPDILSYITIGINEVTKKLETLARPNPQTIYPESLRSLDSNPPPSPSPLLVFVCREDVDPPLLISHLPQLVAACNTTIPREALVSHGQSHPYTWLIPLPRGAEASLATALALRRVSVISIEGSTPGISDVLELLQSVPIVTAPWMTAPLAMNLSSLVPTHIKQLKTSAPSDMKMAKEKRAQGKAEAKKKQALKGAVRNLTKGVIRDATAPAQAAK